MKNQYKYLVSFTFNGGCGNFYSTTSFKINSFQHLNLIKEKIEKENRLAYVAISSYQLVRKIENRRKFIR
ncbi:hypothetical protein [Romboutsia sp.]|uniref:hypothetical protein n=1 Tax=Romboutsia sp. TaxID=1965302 RepID=UPI002CB79C4D|nr:hypothetical protein [Romboutsia sp.]HSQ90176.1 hypothetical protein [Romboutsia sp.]